MFAARIVAATVVGIDLWLVAAALAVVAIGSAVQGSIGFGMGLLAAPALGLIDEGFLPVAVVVAVIPLGIGVVVNERDQIDWREVAFALAGRMPGVVLGTWLVHSLGTRAISVVIAVSVLVAVAGSLTTFRFRPTRRNLVLAGFASGITGTAAGIGGPPMALTYQHADAARLRATLGGFFAVGAVMSFVALAIGGQVGRREMQLALLLIPAVLAGLGLSRWFVHRLPASRLRPAILAICCVSALGLLIETFA